MGKEDRDTQKTNKHKQTPFIASVSIDFFSFSLFSFFFSPYNYISLTFLTR